MVPLLPCMKNYLEKKWQIWRGTVLFITCVVLPVRASIAAINFVPTGSMNPTILEGVFGVMPREKIVGRASHVVMPFDKIDKFQPRWKQFFTGFK